ncbi:S-adenosyl-L-methionine-dependent methyltransferase [Salix suchowensis]|nr:S-adenosyl-L-methionine-dependent methyltransferase [Salix suchowensis]
MEHPVLRPCWTSVSTYEYQPTNLRSLSYGYHLYSLDEAFKAAAYSWETLSDQRLAVQGTRKHLHLHGQLTLKRHYGNSTNAPRSAIASIDSTLACRAFRRCNPQMESLAVVRLGKPTGRFARRRRGRRGWKFALSLAANFPKIKIVVQDLSGVIWDGKKVWAEKMPDAIQSGQVTLEASERRTYQPRLAVHNFFEPQSQKGAAVYLLKQILHDWSDEYCVKILSQLRIAAVPKTKLVLMDSIMPFACHDPSANTKSGIPGGVPREAPAPLLANFGAVNEMGYNADIDERTITHFDELLGSTGWKAVKVYRQEGGTARSFKGLRPSLSRVWSTACDDKLCKGYKDASPAWANHYPPYNASGYPTQPLSQGLGVRPLKTLGSHEMRKPRNIMERSLGCSNWPTERIDEALANAKYQAQLHQSTYGREPRLRAADSRWKQKGSRVLSVESTGDPEVRLGRCMVGRNTAPGRFGNLSRTVGKRKARYCPGIAAAPRPVEDPGCVEIQIKSEKQPLTVTGQHILTDDDDDGTTDETVLSTRKIRNVQSWRT